MYLRDLAVHKDHLPHHRMTSQSAEQLCNYDDIGGPCVSLLILAPKLHGTVPLKFLICITVFIESSSYMNCIKMPFERPLLSECSGTNQTLERSFTRVDSHVEDQVRFRR